MGYKNETSVGYAILKATGTVCSGCSDCAEYNVLSHGDVGATYNSLVNADLPEYTAKFYSPTQHEQLSDVKYSKLEIGYEKDLKEIHEAIKGLPLELYAPQSVVVPEGGGTPTPVVVKDSDKGKKMLEMAAREITKAQQEVVGVEVRVEEIFARRITVRKIKKTRMRSS